MASVLYPKFKESILQAGLNLSSLTVKAVFLDSADYTYSAAHDFLSDVAAGSRVGTAQTLGSKTFTNGVFDAADVTFTGITGDPSEVILIYVDTGTESTSALIAYIDGITVTPAGQNVSVLWNASGIFAL